MMSDTVNVQPSGTAAVVERSCLLEVVHLLTNARQLFHVRVLGLDAE